MRYGKCQRGVKKEARWFGAESHVEEVVMGILAHRGIEDRLHWTLDEQLDVDRPRNGKSLPPLGETTAWTIWLFPHFLRSTSIILAVAFAAAPSHSR